MAFHIYSKSSSITRVATIADNICKDNTTNSTVDAKLSAYLKYRVLSLFQDVLLGRAGEITFVVLKGFWREFRQIDFCYSYLLVAMSLF